MRLKVTKLTFTYPIQSIISLYFSISNHKRIKQIQGYLQQISNMLHQLLFALIGKPGDIIKINNQEMKIQSGNKVLQQSQIALINSMVTLGFHFSNIQQYISNVCVGWVQPKTNQEQETNKSAFLKAFCYGLNQMLNQYKALLIGFQKKFLENRFFTYAGIHAQLGKYYILFPEIWAIISKIQQQNLRGGMILELLYTKIKSSSLWIKEEYQLLFDKCYNVIYNQIGSWILYGKLLDIYNQFFIHKIELSSFSKVQKDWDSMYTLEINMIPTSIISHQVAEKILFIGKGANILKIINKQISKLPDQKLVFNIGKLRQFDSYSFNATIQEIRYMIANQLIIQIMEKENLMEELASLKEFYLMTKGQFFYTFLQQAQGILSLPYSKKAEQNLNTLSLMNAFTRIGQEVNPKVSLQVKQNGFTYNNFASTVNLTILGNVSVRPSNYIKFQPVRNYGGSLWHNMKQPVESGFTTRVQFRFKKTVYGASFSLNSTLPASRNRSEQISSTSICYVIQNSNEISSWKKNAPISLQEIQQYICVKIGMQESLKNNQATSFIILSYFTNNEQKILGKTSIRRNNMREDKYFDFAEQDFHELKISYSNDMLKVSLEENDDKNGISVNMKLSKVLGLDMGRAYMGFLQNSINSCYSVDIVRWEVLGINAFNTSDYWGDLTINYSVDWPLNLILSNQLIQKYQQLYRMFFPIRTTQIQIDKMWLKLQRKIKIAKRSSYKFLLNICAFRSQLSVIINAIWNCFQKDIIDSQWDKLKQNLKNLDDFQKLRQYLDSYIKSIQNMCFLTTPKVLRSIFDIIKSAKEFIYLNVHMESEEGNLQNFSKAFVEIKKKYKQAHRILMQQLTTLFNTSNSNHINQLLTKLDFNHFYQDDGLNLKY